MSDSTDEQSEKNGLPDPREPQSGLDELRKLLLEPVQKKLDELQKRLDTPDLHAKDISKVLPEAISLRTARDKKIEMALEPITENAIKSSIKRDRKVLVDALFPVMGPAIRRAIASAIQGMVQSFNQILEYSLSVKGLKWRLEALRTQKPFAEVVLLHTLVYQVEQAFLIHRETGLVLQHAATKVTAADDPDLVSSMLTAIKDFVQDSFGGAPDEILETLRVGERHVWIEHGPHAFLAAVIRGNPPVQLQNVLKDALEEIHFRLAETMKVFEGDPEPFEEVRPILEDCLQAQFKKEQRKPSYLLWIVAALILIFLGAWSLNSYRENRRWSGYISGLRDQPGIVITSIEKKDGAHHIYGLRDPLAPDPAALQSVSDLHPRQIIFHWEPYYSLLPEFAGRRLNAALSPPDTVNLKFKKGVLTARGAALRRWIETSRERIAVFSWVAEYDDSELIDIDARLSPPETVSLELRGSTLHASGTAKQSWLQKAQKKIKTIADVSNFQYAQLITEDRERIDRLRQDIHRQTLFFKTGSKELIPGQQDIIEKLIMDFKELDRLTIAFGEGYQIEITGHSDSTGTEEINMHISRQRAEAILAIFLAAGFENQDVITRGVGDKEPPAGESGPLNQSSNRAVTFKIHMR